MIPEEALTSFAVSDAYRYICARQLLRSESRSCI